jgi:hypothetical protein
MTTEEDLTNWLHDSYSEGTFEKEEAEYIISIASSIQEKHKIADMSRMLFKDFISSLYFESFNIVQESCYNFLQDLKKSEKLAYDLKQKEHDKLYHNLIE